MTYFSREGTVYHSMKHVMEFMSSSQAYTDQQVENCKEFLKSVGKENRFCRQFMHGKVDKCKKLYKRFVNTTLFHKYLNAKRKEALAQFT